MLADQLDYIVVLTAPRSMRSRSWTFVPARSCSRRPSWRAATAIGKRSCSARSTRQAVVLSRSRGQARSGRSTPLPDRLRANGVEVGKAAARAPLRRQDRRRSTRFRAARSVPAVRATRDSTRAAANGQALQALVAAREGAVNAKRAALCQLRDLLVTTRSRSATSCGPLTRAQLLQRLTATRPGGRRDPELRGSLLALRSLARRVLQLTAEDASSPARSRHSPASSHRNSSTSPASDRTPPPSVLSWSHRGRIVSEAAFARLAGAAPIPASSGQTIRYRLDRAGDRKLNRALHMILVTRKRTHPATIAYIQRRLEEGKTRREANRCLKRYLARNLYRLLENPPQPT